MAEKSNDTWVPADWFLQNLTGMVNQGLTTIPITLMVQGAIVSGYMINGRQYFQEFSRTFAGAWDVDSETKDVFEKGLAELADTVYSRETSDPKSAFSPHFIHLRDARVYSHADKFLPKGDGVLWRGRVESVDAYVLGLFGPDAL